MVRELGLERRETVWFLSIINVLELKKSDSSTKGLRKMNLFYGNLSELIALVISKLEYFIFVLKIFKKFFSVHKSSQLSY